ncbi:MAG: hypothetical protein JNK40_02720 [Chromatiales bacterium]|nr:hypothetical protein [Chromatiales bacterium]
MAQGLPYTQVAEQSGLAIQTLYNLRASSPEFRRELDRLQRLAYAEGVYQLRSLVGQATETLRAIMAAPDASYRDKLGAARAVFEYAGVSPDDNAGVAEEGDDPEFAALLAIMESVLGATDGH